MLSVSRKAIKRVEEADSGPDLSFIGRYTVEPLAGAIDRQDRGIYRRGEYRYFVPAMTGEETGNAESPEQDYQRMEAYNRGEWGMVGIYAKVDVEVPAEQGGYSTIHTFRSPGLWGIESDSEESYFAEVFAEEVRELVYILKAFGVSVTD